MGTLLGLIFGSGLILAITGSPRPPRIRRRRERVYWPRFIDDVAGGVRAGLGLPEATWQAGRRLPAQVAAAFAEVEQQWRLEGGFPDALGRLGRSIPEPGFQFFVQAATLANRQGGRAVPAVLTQLADSQRSQSLLLNEIRGRQATTINSARVAVAAPWLVLLLTGSRADVRVAYLTPTGLLVLVAVAGVSTLAYLMMSRLAEIKELRVVR